MGAGGGQDRNPRGVRRPESREDLGLSTGKGAPGKVASMVEFLLIHGGRRAEIPEWGVSEIRP